MSDVDGSIWSFRTVQARMCRVLVTGSRDWPRRDTVWGALDDLQRHHDRVVVVHGACPTGADLHAHLWACENGAAVEPHPADWKRYGRAAGPIRNQTMVDLGAHECFAFIHNNSRGATQCAQLARHRGIPVTEWRDG